ncbi:TraU family protein [Klebsiella pneumoniae]
MPLDILFWCAGSSPEVPMYPFSGWVSNEVQSAAVLVTCQRAHGVQSFHRRGQIMRASGRTKAVCYEYPVPDRHPRRWRYQMAEHVPGQRPNAIPWGVQRDALGGFGKIRPTPT